MLTAIEKESTMLRLPKNTYQSIKLNEAFSILALHFIQN